MLIFFGPLVSFFTKSALLLSFTVAGLQATPPIFDAGGTGCENPRFGTLVLSDTYAGSNDTVVGDFNNDGVPDLAIQNSTTATLTVQFGLGGGQFGPPRIVDSASNTLTVLTTDLNNDGNEDLLTTARIYLGAGDGTFPSRRTPSFTATTARYVASDFNGDDRIDVVSIKYLVGTLEISYGDGFGGFSPPVEVSFPVGQVSDFAVGEFNHDGIADIAAIYSSQNGVGIILGGTGGLQTAQSYTIPGSGLPSLIAVGDLDTDGDADLLVTGSQFGGSMPFRSTLFNDGAGVFSAQSQVPDSDASAVKLNLFDINQDGRPDFVKTLNGYAVIRLATTPGAFDDATYIDGLIGQNRVFFTDFTGDGVNDLGFNSSGLTSFAVLPGTSERMFGQAPLSIDDHVLLDLSSGDFDEDGVRDVAIASDSNKLFVLFGNGATFVNPISMDLTQTPNHLLVGDFNHDDHLDLLAITRAIGTAKSEMFFGNGDGTFQARIVGNIPDYRLTGKPAALTIDADGFVDLVVPSSNLNRIAQYRNNGDGTFSPFPTLVDVGSTVYSVTAGDLNGDGIPDLAILTGSVHIFFGNHTAVPDPVGVFPALGATGHLFITDFNGDSIPDLAVSSQQSGASGTLGRLIVMTGAGNGGFGAPTQYFAGRGAFSITADDFDSDGNRDLAVANQGGSDSRVTLFFGDGDGFFSSQMQIDGGLSLRGLQSWDYDSDSKPDLIVLDYSFAALQLLKNTCAEMPSIRPETINLSSDMTVLEGNSGDSQVEFTVSLSSPSTVPVSVRYRTSPYAGLSTATENGFFEAGARSDYVPVSGTIVFAPGQTVATIPVTIHADVLDEYDEMFTLTLSRASNAHLAERVAIVTISDDDSPPTLSVGSVPMPEGDSGSTDLVFPATLSAPSGKPIAFRYATGSGTATPDQDYVSSVGWVSIVPGVTQATIPIPVSGDLTVESDETFFVDTFDRQNVQGGARATGTINNDDLGGTVQLSSASYSVNEIGGSISIGVTRTGGNGGGVSVRVRTEGVTATAGQDYLETTATLNFDGNVNQRTISIPILVDQLDEPDETLNVILDQPSSMTIGVPSTAVVTIIDNDDLPNLTVLDASVVEGDNTQTQLKFSLRLSKPTQRPVSVDYTTVGVTATPGVDFQPVAGRFTLAPGVTRKSIFVNVFGEFLFEPDETLNLDLSNVANAILVDDQAVGRIVNDEVGTGPRTTLISENEAGTATGNLDSFQPSMSADTRLVTFESFASNLVPGDSNGLRDVFVRDTLTRRTTMVSVNSAGTGGGNCESRSAKISADGRYVAFISCATDIDGPGEAGYSIYRRDLQTNQTRLVSANLNGDPVPATLIDMSQDGRYIAFRSISANLTPIPDVGIFYDVFVRDMQTNTNHLVSVNAAGSGTGNSDSGTDANNNILVKMTPDGRYVLFASAATNIVTTPVSGTANLYRRDIVAQTTSAVTINSAGTQLTGSTSNACISNDGSKVFFASGSSSLTANDTNGVPDIFRRNMLTSSNDLVSSAFGGGPANGRSIRPFCSADGRYVAFESEATNLLQTAETNGFPDVYWKDFEVGTTKLVSVSRDGVTPADDFSIASGISSQGGHVLITSFARNLVDPSIDTNNTYDIYLRDMSSPTARAVSVNEGGTSTGNSATSGGQVSPDGQTVLFSGDASNLVSNDTNGTSVDVFLYSLSNPAAVISDFDGDRITDLAVFRPANRTWYWLSSTNNGFNSYQFGIATDTPVSGDFDGDRMSDLAVFRQGVWYFLYSSDETFSFINFGETGDRPMVADYDGDRKSDLAVFRDGTWLVRESSDGNVRVQQFGYSSDIPVAADFDGDTRSDIAVYRDGVWYVLGSTDFETHVFNFGIAGDRPMPGDYDGDGIGDYVVFRPSTGGWFVRPSSDGSVFTMQFGIITDVPVTGDYDGDGKADIAVYREGVWFYNRSSDQSYRVVSFGLPGDVPLPRR